MSYYGYPRYVPVAERRKKAERAAAKAQKWGTDMSSVAAFRGAIAKTVWGKAWCANLELYGDFANRLPRGRTYVRSGAVVDLNVSAGEVTAQVMGSRLYSVEVRVATVPPPLWRSMSADCAGSISSLVELLQGKLSSAVMTRMCRPQDGLFPAPRELRFNCSCPDGANVCKHVAATLYGIGVRLDHRPELLFTLRGVDASELVAQAAAGLTRSNQKSSTQRVLDDVSIFDVFELEMAETVTVSDAPVAAKANANAKAVKAKSPSAAVSNAVPSAVRKAPAKVAAKIDANVKLGAPKQAAVTGSAATKTPASAPPVVIPTRRKSRKHGA